MSLAAISGIAFGMIAALVLYGSACWWARRSRIFDALDVALGGAVAAAVFGGFGGYKAVQWLGLLTA